MEKVYSYFKNELPKVRTSQGLTREEWIEKHKDKRYVQKIVKHWTDKGKSIEIGLKHAFELYSGSGSLYPFNPNLAVKIYSQFHPTCILDPCAGFGGRLLGALELDVSYIGYDTNTALEPIYHKIVNDISHNAHYEFHTEDSSLVDFQKHEYDMVFTSPPYWHSTKYKPVEIYEEMPHYKNRNEFYSKFIIPMVRNAWLGLSKNGVMVLNITEECYEILRDNGLGEYTDKIEYKRRRTNSKRRDAFYVWKKEDEF